MGLLTHTTDTLNKLVDKLVYRYMILLNNNNDNNNAPKHMTVDPNFACTRLIYPLNGLIWYINHKEVNVSLSEATKQLTWEADWDRLHHVRFLQGVSRVDEPFLHSWRVYAAA